MTAVPFTKRIVKNSSAPPLRLEPRPALPYHPPVNIHVPAFSRRRFLRALGQGTLLAALPTPLWANDVDTITISILHTTDLHGHILPTVDYNNSPDLGGFARCATQIRQWRAANPNSFYVDIGDVYQGTQVGLSTRGTVMIRCLNALACEAWVIGNHEFDWGLDVLAQSVQLSAMPVLSGNAMIGGKPVGRLNDTAGPLTRLRPYLIKEIAGFRIAILSLTTPALATWLPPENLRDFEALDPVEALRRLLNEVNFLKPDAVLVAGHMGLTRRDDYANRVGALTRECPQLTAYIGGHTHQNHSSEILNNVLYTQADHYGIYAGKVDLTFDRNTRRLIRREAATVCMDHQIALDPLILSLAHNDLAAADQVLAQPIGKLVEPFSVVTQPGHPSDIERLIASAIRASLFKQGVQIDAVIHGLFDVTRSLAPGIKTVADAWTILPYENEIVTLELARDDLLALVQDFGSGREARSLIGLGVVASGQGTQFKITDICAADGSPLPPNATYRIALNSYDSQSAGQRFPVIARLAAQPSNHRVLHPIQIRAALIDFFLTHQTITHALLTW